MQGSLTQQQQLYAISKQQLAEARAMVVAKEAELAEGAKAAAEVAAELELARRTITGLESQVRAPLC